MILFRTHLTSALSTVLFLLLAICTSPARATTHSKTSASSASSAGATTVLRGRASWYGREFQGRRTSNGERFNRFQYTCAHRTLPFGTRLRVTNKNTGKSVVVRVSDRGPFRHQRILDLAEVAARPLDIVRLGAVTVLAEVVPAATPLGPTETPDNLAEMQAADPAPEAAFTTFSVPADEPAAETEAPATTKPAEVAVAAPVAPAVAVAANPATTKLVYLVQAGTFADPANAQAMLTKLQALDQQLAVRLSAETSEARLLNRVLVGSYGTRAEAEALRRRLRNWGIGGLVREVAAL
jgi:rare lipoprotein A